MHRTARTISAAIALTMAAGITACGSSGGAGVAADKKQTLTVWAMGTEGEKLADVAEAYEKANPHITVKVTPIGWDVAHQKLVSAAAAGTLPDVTQMGSSYLGEFVELGVLEPVDTKTFSKDTFFPAAWEQGVADGEVYGVPWYVETRALYYRTDLAKKAGLTKPPATWPELQQAAAAFQEKAGTKWGLHLQPSGLDAVQSLSPFLYSAGGSIVSDGKATMDSPETVKALAEYGTYFEKGLSNKTFTPGYDVLKDFNSGDVPMFYSGPWSMTGIKDNYPDLEGKWAIAKVPAEQTSASMAGGSSLVVSKDSEHKEAAKKFLTYLTGTEGQADWFTRSGDLPANTSAWESGKLAADPHFKVFREQLETAESWPVLPKWTEISSKADEAISEVTQGKESAEDAAKKAQSEIEGLVE